MLLFLSTVRILRFRAPLAVMFDVAADWSDLVGVDVVVNSIDDGTHSLGTLHGRSLAADFDTAGDVGADLEHLYEHFRIYTPLGFDVIHEGDHVHVEWDVHRRPSRLAGSRAAPIAPIA